MAAKKVARVIWTEPALRDLDVIADYIALDNADAAARLVKRIFDAAERLEWFPRLGRGAPELRDLPYREVIVPPCRVLYRIEGKKIYVVLVIRGEEPLEEHRLWR